MCGKGQAGQSGGSVLLPSVVPAEAGESLGSLAGDQTLLNLREGL